jgi:hypothetical protein
VKRGVIVSQHRAGGQKGALVARCWQLPHVRVLQRHLGRFVEDRCVVEDRCAVAKDPLRERDW